MSAPRFPRSVPQVADWLVQVGELPSGVYLVVLGVVMMLDAIPLLGVLVPGDVAVLAGVGVGRPASVSAFLAVIAGCLGGWSLTFLAGRRFGARLRTSRAGAWIGEGRWAAAERMLGNGGGRMVMVAPFLPVLNALLPLAAGGLRMSYRRFVGFATVGALLWAGLYMVLGTVARSVGGLLPGESVALLGTVAFGLLFGGLVLLGIRRRLGSTVEV